MVQILTNDFQILCDDYRFLKNFVQKKMLLVIAAQ